MNKYKVLQINALETYFWLKKVHYAKRIPSISWAFGLYQQSDLVGVCRYGMPASPWLCRGVCGKMWESNVLELNRLCLKNNKKNEASLLIGRSLKLLPKPMIIVSYADEGHHHTGYVYQACNFIYTGKTLKRTDVDTGQKHSRHYKGLDMTKRKIRTAKHRYVYFVANKSDKKKLFFELRYPQKTYPKTKNKNYNTSFNFATQAILDL